MVVAPASTLRGQKSVPLRLIDAEVVGNVPGEMNAFIGRDRELGRLRELQSESRLLTLVGPGGVGKTRLALRLVSELSESYPDGIWLADLSAVSDPALVPLALGDVLGIREPTESWAAELARVLRWRRLLLVFDNCEHLAAACAELLAGLIRACPYVACLATSLQPLEVTGETTWRVPPLTLPSETVHDVDEVAASEAVRLFVTRARAHLPDFSIGPENAGLIAEICRRLDGLPLALELVAARVESLGVAEVAARVARGFDVASGSAPTAPVRQRTLRAALDWSWSLLDQREQVILRRLAVFAGGWRLGAALEVCGSPDALPEASVIDALGQLVGRSLVVADHLATSVRYRLLDTVRTYAYEQLAAAGEAALLERVHARFMLHLGEQLPDDSINTARAALLFPEEDNVRSALAWTIRQQEPEAGLRLAIAAYPMWHFTGHYTEGATWLDQILDLPNAADAPLVTQCLAIGYSGQLRLMLGEYDVAAERGHRALQLAELVGDTLTTALLLEMLGNVALQRGDLRRAEALHTDSANRKRALENRRLVSNLLQLGLIANERRDFERGRELVAEIEALTEVRGQPLILAGVLNLRGLMAAGEGATATAVRLFEQAVEIRRPNRDQQGLVKTLTSLGHARFELGQTQSAMMAFAEGLRGARASGERVRALRAIEGVARCVAQTNPEIAVHLAGATDAQRLALGTVRWPTEVAILDSWLPGARRSIGQAAFAHAWEDGQSATLAEAISLVEALTAEPVVGESRGGGLSQRERQVAGLLARGLTNKQVAAELVVSPATVRSHVEHILVKLDLRSRAQIAVWATQQGLLSERATPSDTN